PSHVQIDQDILQRFRVTDRQRRNGQDCKPVQATVLPNGNYYLPKTDEVIPADMATPSPDDRFHHCFYYPMVNPVDPYVGPAWDNKPKSRCFFPPMHFS